MRSPVYLAIKRNAPKLESLGAFMELLSRFELESTSRGAGSAGARSDLGLKCASRKGMRSPVLPTVKENLQNPKALKVSGAAIQIRTGDHVPRSRLRGSPERPRIEMRFAQGDEVSSLSCNKKCSETRKSRSIYGAAIQIRTGVHVPRSRLRGSPERPRIEMRFAQGDEVSSLSCNKKCSETRKSRSIYGAAIQIRTGDLILTKDALYLLSYSSIS